MKLKDYLHYYYGQQCLEAIIVPGQDLHFEQSVISTRTLFNIQSGLSEVKPVLRRLEDMTEKEARGFLKHAVPGAEYITHNEHAVIWESQGSRASIFFLYGPPAGFHYLLQQHFDLFGLIDAGLAVDVKTITP